MEKLSEKTLFEKLFDEEICFAIVVSRISFTSLGSGYSAIDYGCIINKKDKKKCKNLDLSFYQPKQGNESPFHSYEILEYDMDKLEIMEFKNIQKKFIKVEHNNHGRVYELLTDSFKTKYKSINN